MKSKSEIIKEINRLSDLDFSDEHDYLTRINALKWVLDGDYSSDEDIDNIDYKPLHTLAVARFRAGEELRDGCYCCVEVEDGVECCEKCLLLKEHQLAIAAYEAAVKGEGE